MIHIDRKEGRKREKSERKSESLLSLKKEEKEFETNNIRTNHDAVDVDWTLLPCRQW